MPPSSEPKRLQVIERVITVLRAIVAGPNYWYTPHRVYKKFVHPNDVNHWPVYMVFLDSGGEIAFAGSPPQEWDENFYINIKGIVQHSKDTVTPLVRTIRDVRTAIYADFIDPTLGTLHTITEQIKFEEGPETDNGYFSIINKGFWEQRLFVKINGEFSEL
jgi:hypothetical protein